MEEYIKWECIVCGLIYDEAEGWPEDGIELEQNGKMFRLTGFVLTVELEKKILRWFL